MENMLGAELTGLYSAGTYMLRFCFGGFIALLSYFVFKELKLVNDLQQKGTGLWRWLGQ